MTWTEWKQVEGFTFDDIIYEKKSIIESGAYAARVTINRPARHNAVTDVTGNEMRYAFDDASRDPMVGIVVITGAGDRAFCSGGDVNWEAGENYGIGFSYGSSMQKMLRLTRVPVLAAVKGYAIGGGNHLAYMCDFTIAADNAIFGQVGPRVGSPADGYYVSYLTHVVGHKKAREMWMLCRRYNAQEGLEMGLANKSRSPCRVRRRRRRLVRGSARAQPLLHRDPEGDVRQRGLPLRRALRDQPAPALSRLFRRPRGEGGPGRLLREASTELLAVPPRPSPRRPRKGRGGTAQETRIPWRTGECPTCCTRRPTASRRSP